MHSKADNAGDANEDDDGDVSVEFFFSLRMVELVDTAASTTTVICEQLNRSNTPVLYIGSL